MGVKNKNLIIIVATIIIIGLLGYWIWWQSNQPGKLDDFAKCLTEKGVKFYGTFWCPHCQSQKDLFGNSKKYLPYIECSTPDSNGQLEICRNEKVKAYPTWVFEGDVRQEGELSVKELSEKSGCELPK